MTGMGRTGKPFAVQHWNVAPDVILVGKGIASGYAPLGAVLVAPRVAEAFEQGSGTFQHGFTYQAHPVATAAGNAVFDYNLSGTITNAEEVRDLAALGVAVCCGLPVMLSVGTGVTVAGVGLGAHPLAGVAPARTNGHGEGGDQ